MEKFMLLKKVNGLLLGLFLASSGIANAVVEKMYCSFIPNGNASKIINVPTKLNSDGRPMAEIRVGDKIFSAIDGSRADQNYNWLALVTYKTKSGTGERVYLSKASSVFPKGGFKNGWSSLMLEDEKANIFSCNLH